jgi:hypothetical protein
MRNICLRKKQRTKLRKRGQSTDITEISLAIKQLLLSVGRDGMDMNIGKGMGRYLVRKLKE